MRKRFPAVIGMLLFSLGFCGLAQGQLPFSFGDWDLDSLLSSGNVALYLTLIDSDHSGGLSLSEVKPFVPGMTQDVFNVLDKDADGEVSVSEIQSLTADDVVPLAERLIRAIDTDWNLAISLEEASAFCPFISESLLSQVDQNGDDVLDTSDLESYLPYPVTAALVEDALGLFLSSDANSDGCFTLSEAQGIIPGMSEALFSLADKTGDGSVCLADVELLGTDDILPAVDALLAAADADGDRALSFAEADAFLPLLDESTFEYLDQNGDGVLSVKDIYGDVVIDDDPLQDLINLVLAADADGSNCLSLTEAQTIIPLLNEAVFALIDSDNDGELCIDDAQAASWDDVPALLEAALALVDTDADARISFAEAQVLLPGLTEGMFSYADANGDGYIDADDFSGMITIDDPTTGGFGGTLDELLALADTDGDGAVSFAEVTAIFPGFPQVLFTLFDTDSDGVLTSADLGEIVEDPLEHLRSLFGVADADGDNVVTFDELLALASDLTQDLFNGLDTDGDGELTAADFAGESTDSGEGILALIEGADADFDGTVTQDELLLVLPGLTSEQFAAYDANGDGVLSLADLAEGLSEITTDSDFRHELLKALVRADIDQNGKLDAMEIAKVFPDAPTDLLSALDTDHDWAITRAELMAVLSVDTSGTEEVISEDSDCDGSVTAADIQITINHAIGIEDNVLPPDIDGNGQVDAVDIQRVILRVLRGL